jgi:uncharacterized repeat protein (TIGR01451 family)
LGESGTADLLLAYESPATGVRTVTQNFLVVTGSDENESVLERQRLFQNAVWWLLRRPLCGLTDLLVSQTALPSSPKVGAEVTYTLTVQRTGECEGTGVVVTDVLPAGVKFVSAETPQGTWSEANGVVSFHLGLVQEVFLPLKVTVIPMQPGQLINLVQIRGKEREQNLANNSSTLTATAE